MLVDQSFGKRRLNRKDPLTVKAITRFRRFPIRDLPIRDLPIGIMLIHEESGQSLDLKMSVEEATRIANELLQHCREAGKANEANRVA